MPRLLVAVGSLLVLLAACASTSNSSSAPGAASTTSAEGGTADIKGAIELVESAPVETTLGHTDIPDAADVWPPMIARAQRTIDIGAFYASDGDGPAPTKLSTVLDAIDVAIGRGVHVRVIADAGFAVTYPRCGRSRLLSSAT